MKRIPILLLGALLALGCGSSTKKVQHDAGVQEDSGTQWDATPGQHDANTQHDAAVTCGFGADLGTPTLQDSFVDFDTSLDPTETFYYVGFLNMASSPDLVEIDFFNGYGVFTDGIKTGTFTLSGEELNGSTCGICVFVESKVDVNTFTPAQYYFATGGTVTLTSVSGRVTGTLSNVTFEHVTMDTTTMETTPANDGCNTKIGSLAFDQAIEAPDGGFLAHDGGHD